jgi:hypothetical protein
MFDNLLNTLAQNRTANKGSKATESLIYGAGTVIENNPAFLKRAKKILSNALL